MDEILMMLIVGILACCVTAFFAWTKRKGWDKTAEQKYNQYKMFFDAFGMLIKSIDEQLYKEIEEAMNALTDAYKSDTVSAEQFLKMVNEFEDVYKRAKELIDRTKRA